MQVTVRLYAGVREKAGCGSLALDLPEGADVRAVRDALAAACPSIRDQLPFCRLALDDDFAAEGDTVAPGSKVDVIPPVSGG